MGPIHWVIPVSGKVLDNSEVLGYRHVERRGRFCLKDTVVRWVPSLLRSGNKSVMILDILPQNRNVASEPA